MPNSFDDEILCFRKKNGKWDFYFFKVSTDPGTYYLNNPMQALGTAILKKGQYLDAWNLGTVRWGIPELLQRKPVTIIRDYNRDNVLDFWSGRETTGLYGINIHTGTRAGGESIRVDNWSAGCTVFAKWTEYQAFLNLCKEHKNSHGNSFSYTLIDKRELARLRIRGSFLGFFVLVVLAYFGYKHRQKIKTKLVQTKNRVADYVPKVKIVK